MDKVKIGNYDYKKNFTDKTLVFECQECKGIIDYNFHEILINNKVQDKQGMVQTLLHEVLHGLVNERKIDFNSDEENVIDELSIAFLQIIIDNPNFVEKILKMMKSVKEENN